VNPLRWLYVHELAPRLDEWRNRRAQRERERNERIMSNFAQRKRFECPHDDYLCARYGCPDDPNWKGDRK
jgi:hypothetical protein